MLLALTDDQTLLHDTAVHFIEAELSIEAVRALHDDPVGFDRGWLRKSAELGWYSTLVSEADGGGSISGEGLVDATLVAEELGRHVQPGPFIEANVVAAALASYGSEDQKARLLPGILDGESVATWAHSDADGRWDRGAGVVATRTNDGFTLDGHRGYVSHAADADLLLVVARLDGQPAQFVVEADAEGVTRRRLACLDLSRRMAHVDLDGVLLGPDNLLGDGDASSAIERELQVALALLAADTVGAMDALFEMTIAYAKDRIAFGRPIGSFQALKHLLADAAVDVETCKAGAVAAAAAVQADAPDALEVTSMVAAFLGERSDDLAQMALQLHGGIGYTWEHDLHLLMRRIRSNASLFGEPTWHRERVCAFHGLGEAGAR